jgi:hypothetical protein
MVVCPFSVFQDLTSSTVAQRSGCAESTTRKPVPFVVRSNSAMSASVKLK